MFKRTCSFIKDGGSSCGAAPLRDGDFCFWHDPDHAVEAAEARRLGGVRRRREKAVEGAYELDGLDTIEQIRRLLHIAVVDTLALENSVQRSRTLISAVMAAAKLLEVGVMEERLQAIEAVLGPRVKSASGSKRW